jgi:hypothetical protein
MSGEIIKLSEDLMHPRNYVAPSRDNAQTEGSGKGKIATLGKDQIFNNDAQSSGGPGSPGVWGGVSYPAPTSSAEAGTAVASEYYNDLTSGQWGCKMEPRVKGVNPR